MQFNASIPSIDFNPVARVQAETPVEKPEVKQPQPVQKATETPRQDPQKAENLQKLQEVLTENNITLKFRQDQETKQLVVELVNDKTGEAVRQIPSQISLKLAAAFVKMQGQFVDETK